MKNSLSMKPLGGWTRLWVVASVCWVGLISAMMISAWPDHENYKVEPTESAKERVATRADIETAISNAEKAGATADAAILREFLTQANELSKPPPGYVLDVPTGEEPWIKYAAPVAATGSPARYNEAAFSEAKSELLMQLGLAAIIPPALLAAAMFSFQWIRRGFAG